MLDSVAPSDSAVPSDSLVPATPVVKKPLVIDKTKAQKFFDNFPKDKIVSYKEYWETVKPKNTDDIFRRYLFAFCSVHTTWEGNVRGYNAIKNFDEWTDNKESLKEKLHKSGVGLHNNRTEYIWAFKDKFFANPKDFYLTTKKYHVKKRDSIVDKIKGLGLAKISFALEMTHPNEARALCLDIHMLRLYNMDGLQYTKSKHGISEYKKMERHWSVNCGKLGVPSYIARSIYWDGLQKQETSHYWSFVLE